MNRVTMIKNNTFEESLIIVNRYINNNFGITCNSDQAIIYLKNLFVFLNMNNISLDNNMIVNLIEMNKKFTNVLNVLLQSKMEIIKNKGFDSVFSDKQMYKFMKVYTMLKNISLEKNNEYNDIDTNESLQMLLNEAQRYPILTKDEVKILAQKIENGDMEARNLLIKHNIKLVISIAKKYSGYGLPLVDLVQEGFIGLMSAIEKYNYRYNNSFSTYAVPWINQSIFRAIAKQVRLIKLPIHLYEKVVSYYKANHILEHQLNREPTLEEIATHMNISVEKVLYLKKVSVDAISLNNKVDNEKECEFIVFAVSSDETPEEIAVANDFQDKVQEILANTKFTEKEKEVIEKSFGFNNCELLSRPAIAKIYGVKRQRVDQIYTNALRKIRAQENIKSLAMFMDYPEKALIYLNEKNMKKERIK